MQEEDQSSPPADMASETSHEAAGASSDVNGVVWEGWEGGTSNQGAGGGAAWEAFKLARRPKMSRTPSRASDTPRACRQSLKNNMKYL